MRLPLFVLVPVLLFALSSSAYALDGEAEELWLFVDGPEVAAGDYELGSVYRLGSDPDLDALVAELRSFFLDRDPDPGFLLESDLRLYQRLAGEEDAGADELRVQLRMKGEDRLQLKLRLVRKERGSVFFTSGHCFFARRDGRWVLEATDFSLFSPFDQAVVETGESYQPLMRSSYGQ